MKTMKKVLLMMMTAVLSVTMLGAVNGSKASASSFKSGTPAVLHYTFKSSNGTSFTTSNSKVDWEAPQNYIRVKNPSYTYSGGAYIINVKYAGRTQHFKIKMINGHKIKLYFQGQNLGTMSR